MLNFSNASRTNLLLRITSQKRKKQKKPHFLLAALYHPHSTLNMGAACRLLRVAGGDLLHDLEREGLIALLDAVSKLGDPFGFLPPEGAGPQVFF